MPEMTSDSLSRAIAYLGAVEVAPGRYAIPYRLNDRSTAYYVMGRAGIQSIYRGHSGVATAPDARRLPVWWTPERREAYYIVNSKTGLRESPPILALKAPAPIHDKFHYEHVAADLTSGEEIPA